MTNWAEQLIKIKQERAAEIAERRARVLQYPDLAQRLTERPLSFAKPEQWNGFVPPKTVPTEEGYKLNDSPTRAALVAICAEALARDDAGQGVLADVDDAEEASA